MKPDREGWIQYCKRGRIFKRFKGRVPFKVQDALSQVVEESEELDEAPVDLPGHFRN